ncbi:presqualene diphosphate synthase HpnD [Burkholderiaceae bacterium FT117]|uniref:presqualene diphosphate synthase HpnD n=1 Tax=Zeimonas sediminis TaxID=2944268 RepID=UPI00234312AD|nr:presqualene diphosphate synthase HpnD [Zeimonas sediminis]MCM5569148.1 presqualene diphosphate synthase HpnD [Zeimonas sediminis]
MTPDQYCQDKAARSGSSFYYSFLFLPSPRRRAITALYAFCREVDDVVDETGDPQVARAKLDWWRAEIERLFAGDPQHPVTRALQPHLQACSIGRRQLLEIVDGMQMDLDQNRYLDFEGLKLYCHRVAGVVGELAASIFGATLPGTRDYAHELGLAFQLTNIIRDVGEDARKGRIYLPIEDLQRFEVPAHEILAAKHSERFAALMKFEADRAREHYRRAFAALPEADRRAQRPGLIMAAIYATLLAEIERDGFLVLDRRTSLTPIRKLWLAWRTFVAGRPPAV